MRKFLFPLVILIAGCVILSGCTSLSRETSILPTQGLELCPMDYEVIGDTSAEDSRTAIFFIDFAHLFKDESAGYSAPSDISAMIEEMVSLVGRTKRGAMYKALAKIPQADRLLEPRFVIETSSFLGIITTCTAKITAKAIKYTKSSPKK